MSTMRVIMLRVYHPTWSLSRIGKRCGITKQRVHQILNKHHQKTAGIKTYKLCANCGKCVITKRMTYCSDTCLHEYTHPYVSCRACGKLFRKSLYNIFRTEHDYCSRKCQAVFMVKITKRNKRKKK